MVKPAIGLHGIVQGIFTGMTEGRMPQIMRQRKCFGQVFVNFQFTRNRAADLRHLKRMRQPRAVIITHMRHENLCLVLQPPKRAAMQHAVAVALKRGARFALAFTVQPPARLVGVAGIAGMCLTIFHA